jgi:cell division protein FtsA
MENGVALIDFGGGSTSVTIYHGKVMRHYAAIPFGGKNITDDIKSECQISERLAENIKLAYGACMPEKLQSLSEKVLQIMSSNNEPSKQVTVKYLSEIITARIEEIIMAILYEIEESGFADMLKSGIVITGGVAQTANLSNFIYELSGYRVRTGYPKGQFSNAGCNGIKDTSAATSVGLILAAKDELGINCAQACKNSESSVVIEQAEETNPANDPTAYTLPESEVIQEPQEEEVPETATEYRREEEKKRSESPASRRESLTFRRQQRLPARSSPKRRHLLTRNTVLLNTSIRMPRTIR